MPRPPSFDPAHRRPRVGPLTLPAEGRQGEPPPWPLGDLSEDEQRAWEQLWATPQAVAWERLGCVRTVARYCRAMVASEMPGAKAALLAQVTALEDRLGLTPKSMRLLLWQVASDEVAPVRDLRPVTDVKKRIKAVGRG